jgi:hypothetical protein
MQTHFSFFVDSNEKEGLATDVFEHHSAVLWDAADGFVDLLASESYWHLYIQEDFENGFVLQTCFVISKNLNYPCIQRSLDKSVLVLLKTILLRILSNK